MLHAAAVLVGQNSEVVRLELSHELAAVEQPLVQRTHAQQQHIVLPLQRQLCLVHHRHHLPSTARSKYDMFATHQVAKQYVLHDCHRLPSQENGERKQKRKRIAAHRMHRLRCALHGI
jgi:hypothetical protein